MPTPAQTKALNALSADTLRAFFRARRKGGTRSATGR